jgi:hypothetical protein
MTRQMDRALRTLTTLRKERGAREAWKVAFEMPREPWPKRASAADPAPRPASWAGRASVANPLLEPASLAGPLAGQASAANPMPEPASLVDPLAGRVSPADPLPEPASAADPALESAYAVDPAREPANGANNPVLPAAPTKAEQFAARNPLLASRIRAAGGLTRKAIAGFRPSSLPDDATVEALVYGAGPVVATMDRANGTVG